MRLDNILLPDKVFINKVKNVIDYTNLHYSIFLKENDDKDDLEELICYLNEFCEEEKLDIEWHIGPEDYKEAIDWYIQGAILERDLQIDVVLDPDSTIGYWGPKTFKKSALKTLEHEAIHMQQRRRMGIKKFNELPSGYELGKRKYKKTKKRNDMIRIYFRDPHELMAHGHDIARELMFNTKNPDKALRNPEKYRVDLPTYDKYRAIFPSNAKPLQRLLKYTAFYFEYYKKTCKEKKRKKL
jgi:hypothetical protein